MTFRLLSCDGGGIRGYLSSKIIQELHKQTGLLDHVDGFGGTSTGGLISIGLADGRAQGKNMSDLIAEIVCIYETQAKTIFQENVSSRFGHYVEDALKFLGLSGGAGIMSAQYKPDGVQSVADQLVGTRTFGSIPSELVLAVNTAALAMELPQDVRDSKKPDLRNWGAVTLSNHVVGAAFGSDTLSIPLADGALATSAAPTYFPPHKIDISSSKSMYFADGGTFANNPVMNAIEIALAADKTLGIHDVEVISVGTGLQPLAITNANVASLGAGNFGALEWFGVGGWAPAAGLLELTLSASAANQTRIAAALLGDNLARINPLVPTSVELDSTDPKIYPIMDAAVTQAQTTAAWSHAVSLATGWSKTS